MGKRLKLRTRGFGAETGIPDVDKLAAWVADHRGCPADLISYQLDESLVPQITAGITFPCAGGGFYGDRIRSCLNGIQDNVVLEEIGVQPSVLIEDAAAVSAHGNGIWCALPAPHVLGLRDGYYNDEDEWLDALFGAYRTLMRAMRDAGIAGHVLICERAEDMEIAALARQKVFFFAPAPDRTDLATLMEHQRQIAAGRNQLGTVFDLANEYELHQLIVMDPDAETIRLALSHLDPDQVMAGGYCTGDGDVYWRSVVDAAVYTK
jgi:hypothetical protein